MDTFEHDELNPQTPEQELAQEPQVLPADPVEEIPEAAPEQATAAEAPAPQSHSYRGTGRGRRESPYADSPYVMESRESQFTQGYTFQPQAAPQPKVKKAKKKSSGGFWKKGVAAVLVLALVAAGCGITASVVNSRWEQENQKLSASITQLNQQLAEMQKQLEAPNGQEYINVSAGNALSPSQVYAQNVDSVVAITSSVVTTSIYGEVEGSSAGSGFILSENGYIITNHHVIEGATKVFVVTNEGVEYPAEVVGSDSTNDLAVLKVEAENLPAVKLGSSDDLIIGDMVVAIGNPLGDLTSTQTVGYVSGKNREIATDNTIIDMIQTDAAINPGNSGGPLFNMQGEVVGITTAKYSGTTSSGASIEGIGFAIPIDDVLTIISDLMDYGYVTGAYLGVTVQNMDPSSAAMYGLPMGAYVMDVVDGASADRAGVLPKDIITALGEYRVESITDLTRNLRHFKAGDTSTITVIRGGQELVLTITYDERPVGFDGTVPSQQPSEMPSEGDYDEWYDYFYRFFGGK